MRELPEGWAEATLGDLISTLRTGPFGSSVHKTDYIEGGHPLINPMHINGGKIVPSQNVTVSDAKARQLSEFAMKPGDIIIGRRGEMGRCAVITAEQEGWLIGTGSMAIKTTDGLFPDFLQRFLSSPSAIAMLTERSIGSTMVNLNQSILTGLKIAVPPHPEQRRIVAKVDGLTARTARARKELSRIPILIARYKQRLLALAFSGELTAGWRGRNKLAETALPSDISKRAMSPVGWPWVFVDEIGAVGLGRQRSPKNHEGPQMRPYLRSANITWVGLDLTDVKKMNFDERDFERFELKYGDVLLNEGSGSAKEVGKPAIWRNQIEGCCFQNTILRVRPRLCSSEYLYWFFYHTALSEGFVDSTKGMNIQHIGKYGLASFLVPLPSKEEQAEIVRRIESAFGWLDRMAADHAAAARLLPKLDAAILAKAFRGELVPQDPNDEPASVLLERIKAERDTEGKKPKKRHVRAPVHLVDASAILSLPGVVDGLRDIFQTAKKVVRMTKSRQDDDVKDKPYLAGLLKATASSDVQSLFRAADLPVADFYKQLAWEIDKGHILNDPEQLKAA